MKIEWKLEFFRVGMLGCLALLGMGATGATRSPTETVGGYTWTYRPLAADATKVEVVSVSPDPVGELQIPDELGGLPVAGIGSGAFGDCLALTTVVLPDSGKKIEKNAFRGCSGLEQVVLPEGMTNIAANAFRDCVSLKALELPASLANVGGAAFSNCTALAKVVMRSPDVKVGTRAFAACSSVAFAEIPAQLAFKTIFPGSCEALRELVLVEGGTKIAKESCLECVGLEKVTIPSGVVEIGGSAFKGCVRLGALEVPNSVTNIAKEAFSGCTALARVCLRASQIKLGSGAFSGCTSIEYLEAPCTLVCSKVFPAALASLREVVVVEGCTNVVDKGYAGCVNLASVALPASLTAIGSGAFDSCVSLAALEIPPSVVKIESSAFKGCVKLSEMTIPPGLEKLGGNAFQGCAGLQTLTFLGDCPEAVGSGILKDTSERMVVRVPASAQNWPANGSWQKRSLVFYTAEGLIFAVPVIPAEQIVSGLSLARAMEVKGCMMDHTGRVVGIVSLKLGKADRKGISRVNAILRDLRGKNRKSKPLKVDLQGGVRGLELAMGDRSVLQITLGANKEGSPVFMGWLGNDVVTSASVGGVLKQQAEFSFPDGHPDQMPKGAVEEDFLPAWEPVKMSSKKWTCAKAAAVAYKKNRATGVSSWVVNGGKEDPERSNLSGLKLKYDAKKGAFSGTYNVYCLALGRGSKMSVKVTGVVVNGVGYGLAQVKGRDPWPVLIR